MSLYNIQTESIKQVFDFLITVSENTELKQANFSLINGVYHVNFEVDMAKRKLKDLIKNHVVWADGSLISTLKTFDTSFFRKKLKAVLSSNNVLKPDTLEQIMARAKHNISELDKKIEDIKRQQDFLAKTTHYDQRDKESIGKYYSSKLLKYQQEKEVFIDRIKNINANVLQSNKNGFNS